MAYTSGINLAHYWLQLYNGVSGIIDDQFNLADDGIVGTPTNGLNFVYVPTPGIQNGAPDGVALVFRPVAPTILQLLSYEGTFTATVGDAAGMDSTDIGVEEASTTPVGHSLQLKGEGCMPEDFEWEDPMTATKGVVNTNLTPDGCTKSAKAGKMKRV